MKKIPTKIGAVIGVFIVFVAGGIVVGKGGATGGTTFTTIAEMQTAQENYKAQHGKYLQVIKDNKLSKEKTGTPKDYLGKDMPAGYAVNEMERGDEVGYSIEWTDEQGKHSIGHGIDAQAYTYDVPSPIVTATST